MLNKYMGMIMLHNDNIGVRSLTKNRPLASIQVGGRYRLIDFPLSNLTNADIKNVAIYSGTKNNRSLLKHLANGGPWDLDRQRGGMALFLREALDDGNDTIGDLQENLEYLYKSNKKQVVIFGSMMVCNVDVKSVIKAHEESEADVTLVYKKVAGANKSFINCKTLRLDENGDVVNIGKNLGFKEEENINMGIIITSRDLLVKGISEAIQDGRSIKNLNLLDYFQRTAKVRGYEHRGYLKSINTTKEYYDLNMDLLDINIRREIFSGENKIHTTTADNPAAKFENGSQVKSSMISNGCHIKGRVKCCVLARNVVVEEGASVENCIIGQGVIIKKGANLKNIIVDKRNIIESFEELKSTKNNPLVIEKEIEIPKETFQILTATK